MKKVKKKQKSALISNIIFSIITIISLTLAIAFLLINYSLKDRLDYANEENEKLNQYAKTHPFTEEDLVNIKEQAKLENEEAEKQKLLEDIKDIMDNGYSAYYLMRYLFPEDVVILADGGFNFYPISESMKKNDYVIDNFIQDENSKEIDYRDENGQVISLKGIDVSSHNGKINWDKVKKSGVDFVYVRVGYRGSTEGGIKEDTTFADNIKGATKAGLDVGVYFYTQAVDENEAREEAQFVLDSIEPYNVTYPIAYDLEVTDGRTNDVSVEQFTKNSKAFMDLVEKAGYKSMLYGNLYTQITMVNPEELEGYEKWFAYYAYPVYNPYDYAIWQYTSDGKVDGINGNVDLNICLKNLK